MIITQKDRTTTTEENMRGGVGPVYMTPIVPNAKIPHLRLLNVIELAPGSSIGAHIHEAEAEVFYCLEGVATVLDNGEYIDLQPGDAHLCSDGETHSLGNRGEVPCKVIAIIPTVAE